MIPAPVIICTHYMAIIIDGVLSFGVSRARLDILKRVPFCNDFGQVFEIPLIYREVVAIGVNCHRYFAHHSDIIRKETHAP